MWTWLVVGVAAYLVFLACVIVLLRAAKARARVERNADAWAAGPPAGAAIGPVPVGDRPVPEQPADTDTARAHPVPDEDPQPSRACDPGPSEPPVPPASRMRG
ncbi:hypothetical protein ACIBSV_40550 [Embleya sp. NPDC050154]|uniref:hypothetical protein n=1 Tax=Embleya sp. NPDC050154 TaxID=3363988 RepID=UPI00378DB2A0